MNDVISAITNVGFPIFSFLVCAWFLKYTYDKSMTQNEKAIDKIGTLAEAVNNNTKILSSLVEGFKKEGD